MVKTALLDVNVLIALLWRTHPFHAAAVQWFQRAQETGWATCPVTESGFVRVVASPSFASRHLTVHEAIAMLQRVRESTRNHHFWKNDLSITVLADRWPTPLGHKQVTDAYLLSAAHQKKGALVTFDRGIQHLARQGSFPSETVLVLKP